MPETTLISVMQKLDMLDGVKDGQYTDLSLVCGNSTGVCVVEEIVTANIPGDEYEMTTVMENSAGEIVSVDCTVLVERLNTLVGIAQKLPSYKYIADINSGTPSDEIVTPTTEELFGYHIVDHMICSLLLGIGTTSQSFSELFSVIPFDTYAVSVRAIASSLPNMSGDDLDIENASQAYLLFEGLGQKYGFSTSIFRPPDMNQPSEKKKK